MGTALWTVGTGSVVVLLFVLGVLWERKKRPTPPTILDVTVRLETQPQRHQQPPGSPRSDESDAGA